MFLSLKLYGVEWTESCPGRLPPVINLPVSIEKGAERAAVLVWTFAIEENVLLLP